jgi:hypothetical protein
MSTKQALMKNWKLFIQEKWENGECIVYKGKNSGDTGIVGPYSKGRILAWHFYNYLWHPFDTDLGI